MRHDIRMDGGRQPVDDPDHSTPVGEPCSVKWRNSAALNVANPQ
ncbi:hypothetical protein ACFQ9X_12495 [Catenulispora yoronensis]